MSEKQDRIRTYIVNNFLFGDDEGLEDDASLLEQRIIDSTGILELVAYLEKEFCITVNDEELIPENLDSINSVRRYLARKASTLPDCSSSTWVSA